MWQNLNNEEKRKVKTGGLLVSFTLLLSAPLPLHHSSKMCAQQQAQQPVSQY